MSLPMSKVRTSNPSRQAKERWKTPFSTVMSQGLLRMSCVEDLQAFSLETEARQCEKLWKIWFSNFLNFQKISSLDWGRLKDMRKSCFGTGSQLILGQGSQLHQETGQLKISMKTKTSKDSREIAENNNEEENTAPGGMSPLGSPGKHANATE